MENLKVGDSVQILATIIEVRDTEKGRQYKIRIGGKESWETTVVNPKDIVE